MSTRRNATSDSEHAASPPKRAKNDHESSSSESDIETYLHKPESLNLNSTFFKSKVTASKDDEEDAVPGNLSDTDSDQPLASYTKPENSSSEQPLASCSKHSEAVSKKAISTSQAFEEITRQARELEDAKKQVEAYLEKRQKELNQDIQVEDLLALGEKPFDLRRDLAEVGFHASDFESDNESEKGDWEEVEESQEQNLVPKEGVEIIVEMPNVVKKKKGIDLMAALKRRMNRIRKENQVYIHKVHLLCWIAHGKYVNEILNQDHIMCLALSLIPSKESYPPARTNLNYLQQVTTWYHKAVKFKPDERNDDLCKGDLISIISKHIESKVATSAEILVYIFVAVLRALGMQCRLVLSLQVEPLRPPNNDLYSLKQQKKTESIKSETNERKTNKTEVSSNNKTDSIPTSKTRKRPSNTDKKSEGNEKTSKKKLETIDNSSKPINLKKLKSKDTRSSSSSRAENASETNKPQGKNRRKSDISSNSAQSSSISTTKMVTRSKASLVSKVSASIDKCIDELEALERGKPKKRVSKSSEDDISNELRSRKTIDSFPTNSFLLNSEFECDSQDDATKTTSKSKIKIRITSKKAKKVAQTDGQYDSSSSEDNIPQLDGTEDDDEKERELRLKFCKESERTSPESKRINIRALKSSAGSNKRPLSTLNHPKLTTEKNNCKNDIIKLVKSSIRQEKQKTKKTAPIKSMESYDHDSDSDFVPELIEKKAKPSPLRKVKKRVLPRSHLEKKAKETEEIVKKKGIDIWVEVFLEEEEKWISANVVTGKVHCIQEIYSQASHPASYILAWDNTSRLKDVSQRYCPNWNTVTRKLRVEPKWWAETLSGFIGVKNARDIEEDEDLARQQLDQPLPKTISEFKDHPLYVLKRHLLKFQAIYPSDAPSLGFIRNEAVFSRSCVYILHSRDIWLKHAKVVKPGEQPYKIVKARPKYDKLSNKMITDQLLEIFGVWQVEDYVPPTAENGVVPRNAYGNVELFKPCMLPKKCVHLQLPGLNKIARKLNIDCAPAVVGFDFHSGWNHAVYDGFIVCEEFGEELIKAWEQEQEEIVKREQEKYEKRVLGNWRRLIKAALIRARLQARYDFSGDGMKNEEQSHVETVQRRRPKFMKRK